MLKVEKSSHLLYHLYLTFLFCLSCSRAFLAFLMHTLHLIVNNFLLIQFLFTFLCFYLFITISFSVHLNNTAALFKGVRRCQEILTNLSAIVELKFSVKGRPVMLRYRTVTMDDVKLLQQRVPRCS